MPKIYSREELMERRHFEPVERAAARLRLDLGVLSAIRNRFSRYRGADQLMQAIDTFAGRLCGDPDVFLATAAAPALEVAWLGMEASTDARRVNSLRRLPAPWRIDESAMSFQVQDRRGRFIFSVGHRDDLHRQFMSTAAGQLTLAEAETIVRAVVEMRGASNEEDD